MDSERGVRSSEWRTPPPPSPEHLRFANVIALTLILAGLGAVPLRVIFNSIRLWPGSVAFWSLVFLPAYVIARMATRAVSDSKLEAMLRFSTVVITGALTFVVLWTTIAELLIALGVDAASGYRLSANLCLLISAIVGCLALIRRFNSSLPSVLSVEFGLLFFGMTANGMISLWLALLEPLMWVDSNTARIASMAIALGATVLVGSRGCFASQTRSTLRFGSTWLPAVVGSIFAASVTLNLFFAVKLRTSVLEDRLTVFINNGVGLIFFIVVVWILVFGRRWRGLSWVCAALMVFASAYLMGDTRADRRELERTDAMALKAGFSLRSRQYETSLRQWQEVLEIRERVLPGPHGLVVEALAGEGSSLYGLGRPKEAIDVMSRALQIAEMSDGVSDLDTSTLRAKLALSLQQVGRLDEAKLVLASLDVSRLLDLSSDEPELASIMANVADAYRSSGHFNEAERLYRRAIEITGEGQSEDFDAIFVANSGLVRVLSATGRYDEARVILRDLLRLMYRKYRVLQMSECYRLEAEIDASLERFSSAVKLQKQALQVLVKELGRDHPATAAVLRDLGTYLIGTGELGESLVACKSAREIILESLGPESPEIVKADYALACVYAASARYRDAATLLEKCIERWQRIYYGDDHVLISEARHLLARMFAGMGDHRAASDLYGRSLDVTLEHFKSSLTTLSDQQQLAALRRIQQRSSEFMIHTVDHRADDLAAVGRCFDGWLRIKGVNLEIQRARGEMLSRSASEETAAIGDRLRAVENRLAALWFEGRDDGKGKQEVASLQKDKADLEKELNRRLADSGFWVSNEVVTSHKLQGRLPVDTAYVDYCWARSGFEPDRYLAFVLPYGGSSGPQLVDLGHAENIERSVAEYFIRMSLGVEKHPNSEPFRRRLYDSIIRPVLARVAESRALLISPDGVLARLPFSAVIQPSGEYLEDRYLISYLSSGRDVAIWDKPAERKQSAIIFADPNFDSVPARTGAAEDDETRSHRVRRSYWRAPPFDGVRLERLPGTLVEANGIARLLEQRSSLDVLLFTDLNASEEAMAFVESPWLMHFATHGYFFPVERHAAPENLPASMGLLGNGGFRAGSDDNPLARAGLALAGANVALRAGDEWGLLTLDEIMAMPLVDTEMVVLSACESGIDEIRQGEGVFGVGRAFLAAGSRSVVVTLWSVADGPTAELMQDFYARWLAGVPKAEALRQARAKLRRKYPSPTIWAPFVLVGDPS